MAFCKEQAKKKQSPWKGLQGPKPTPLKVDDNSFKIKKQPVAGRKQVMVQHPPPVIIYLKSPEVIHVEARNFMRMVQHLTGSSSASSAASLPLPLSFSQSSAGTSECNLPKRMPVIEEARKVTSMKEIDQGRELDANAEVVDELLSHGMQSLGRSDPLQLSTSTSVFPSPNLFPDFYDFEMISCTPSYLDSIYAMFYDD